MDSHDAHEAAVLLAIQKTLAGDSEAFRSVVEHHSRGLYSLARHYGRTAEDAEEDVQEIFLKAYQALARFDLSRRFTPWLFQIGVNHLRSARRRRVRRLTRAEVVNTDHQVLDEVVTDDSQAPEHEAIERVADEDVLRALDTLPRKWRDAFVLRQMENLSGQEAAQVLGVPEETVRTHLYRARQALQEHLKKRGWG
jgi:RNA polymerase sigma-70 factor (ECF subfamily)